MERKAQSVECIVPLKWAPWVRGRDTGSERVREAEGQREEERQRVRERKRGRDIVT